MSAASQCRLTIPVLREVEQERRRQEEIGLAKAEAGVEWSSCADPNMNGGDGTRLAVLTEELGEVARALLEGTGLREELVQVAAVAVAWVESIDEAASWSPAPVPLPPDGQQT